MGIGLFLFILGTIFGSFFNVVGIRMPLGKSILSPRSHCPSCERTLQPMELIPIVSYMFLRGRCRCGARISFIYPFVEWMAGMLFFISYVRFGFTGELVVAIVLISLLCIIFVSDMRYMLIPDKILLFFTPLLLLLRILFPLQPWWDMLLGALLGFSLLLLIAIVSRGGMGGGDIKLFSVVGIVVGWKGVLLSFVISTIVGAIVGGGALLLGKVERKEPIPFGPFIMFGTLIAYFFGSSLVEWYVYTL